MLTYFTVEINKETYSVRPLQMAAHSTQYEIARRGQILFCLEHSVRNNGERYWSSVGHELIDNKTENLFAELGKEIVGHYLP